MQREREQEEGAEEGSMQSSQGEEKGNASLPSLQCGICLEDGLPEIGELSGCTHLYCFPCASRWMETENRCPACRTSFTTISRKRLQPGGGFEAAHGPNQRLRGEVLEVVQAAEKRQVGTCTHSPCMHA
jgi:hypothetical protein